MITETSRYQQVDIATYQDSDSRTIPHLKRRFVPRGDAMPVLLELLVTERDRMDVITARTLGDAVQFWRVCDANNAMNPFDLIARPGRRIRVPIPQFPGA